MKRLSEYELEKINNIKEELNIFEKMLFRIFKSYTYKVYQRGFRDRYFKE